MKNRLCSVALLVLLVSRASSQETPPVVDAPPATRLSQPEWGWDHSPSCAGCDAASRENGPLSGNHEFANFIGFISDPLQNIDPRAVTAIYPLFGNEWVGTAAPFPDATGQIYGPALTVALSDRLAVGLNQGGYAKLSLSRGELAPRRASIRRPASATWRSAAPTRAFSTSAGSHSTPSSRTCPTSSS